MPPNGHASQSIPPTITRVITKDVLDGSQTRLAWIANSESPINPQAKIAKMIFRFDADDNPDAIEVYCIGMIDNRAIGVRSTIRIEDVYCTDEVMDIATWTDEIKAAEEEGEEEPEEPEVPTVTLKKAALVEPPAALPSPTLPTPSS
jgi:hypothetical protein